MDDGRQAEGIYPWGVPGEMVDPGKLKSTPGGPLRFWRRDQDADGVTPTSSPAPAAAAPDAPAEPDAPREPERPSTSPGAWSPPEGREPAFGGPTPEPAFAGGFPGGAATLTAANSEERTLGAVMHVLSFAGWMVPFANLAAPLLLWLIKKDDSPFLDHQGRQVLDFQITITVLTLVSMLLSLVLIGIPMLIAVGVLDVVLTIVAAVKAADGTAYRYPFALRIFSTAD